MAKASDQIEVRDERDLGDARNDTDVLIRNDIYAIMDVPPLKSGGVS